MSLRVRSFAIAASLTLSALVPSVSLAAGKSFQTAKDNLPSSTVVLASLDLTTLRSTQVWSKFFPTLVKQERDLREGLDKVKAACGVDPVTAVSDISVGADPSDKGGIFIALNGVTEAKFTDCVQKIAKGEGKTITAKKSGNVIELTNDKGKAIFVAWLPGDVLAVTSNPEDRKLLETMIGGKGSLTKNTALTARLAKIDTSTPAFIAWSKTMNMQKVSSKAGNGQVAYAGGTFNLKVESQLGDAKEAENIAKGLSGLLGMMVPKNAPPAVERAAKSVTAKANGADITITASMTEKDLIAALQAAMGGGASGGATPKR